jgi:hypothetical protein
LPARTSRLASAPPLTDRPASRHPGLFDGDDHAIALGEITVLSNGTSCNGSYNWKQAHDSSNKHTATLTWKTRSLRVAGPDLVNSLP